MSNVAQHPSPYSKGQEPERKTVEKPVERPAPSLTDLTRDFQAKEQADASARRSLNALAVTSSLMSALIQNPGPNSDRDSMVNAARTMLRSADEATGQLIEMLGLEKHPWAKYRVMRLASNAVADRWSATSRSGEPPSADVSDLMPMWKELSAKILPEMPFVAPADEPAAALRIALLDSLQPVMHEISIFPMLNDPRAASIHARDSILSVSQQALGGLIADQMSDRSKSMLMQTLLRNAGSIYASAWRRHSEDTIEKLQGMERSAQIALLEANPAGLPLTPIDDAFEASFLKLVEMVQYLSAPKAPTLVNEGVEQVSEYEEEVLSPGATSTSVNA